MAAVLYAEPRQAPLIRESPASSPMPAGKALGVLLTASDRELRKACERHAAMGISAGDADESALMHPLHSFLGHLERLEPAHELIVGCLNHLLDAPPPKKAGQHPRAVRLLLSAASAPRAWPTVCAALGRTLGAGDKRLKLAACLVLRDVLVTNISSLGFDPRVPDREFAGPTAGVDHAEAQMQALMGPLMPLADAILSVAERDGLVDSANKRCDPLPTRLTTLAADCCIAVYIAAGRLVLLPRAQPLASKPQAGGGSGIKVLSSSNTESAACIASSSSTTTTSSSTGADTSFSAGVADFAGAGNAGAGAHACASRRRMLWQALPQMDRLLRLLRQWYAGRKAPLVIGIDGFLARLAPLSKLFALEHHLRDSQRDGELGHDCGGSSVSICTFVPVKHVN